MHNVYVWGMPTPLTSF